MEATQTVLNKYEAYKDSGEDWLGEIPAHWKVKRLGTWFEERRTKVSDKDFAPLSVTKNGILPQLENAAKTNDGDNRKLVIEGDFVINSRSDRKGSSGIAYQDGSVSLINIVMKPVQIDRFFSNYLLKSNGFIEEFYRNGHGIVADLWTTRFDEMKNIKIAVPPLPEQSAIAAFLDEKTAKINQTIAQKERLIELLKERKQILIQELVTGKKVWNEATQSWVKPMETVDSGVEWIGEIPKGWEVKRLKYLAKIRYGLGQPPKEKTDGLPIIRATNIERGKIVEKGLIFVDPNDIPWDRNPLLKENDIIVVRSGAYTGDSARIPKKWEGAVTGYDMVMSPFGISSKFLSYAMLSNYVLHSQLYLLRMRAAQPHLNSEELGETIIITPPRGHEPRTVKHIETLLIKIDQNISLQQSQITQLKEYKSVLIDSAVTGKVKVPGV